MSGKCALTHGACGCLYLSCAESQKRNRRNRSRIQQKSENYSEFSERTEILSRSLRLNLSDLPKKIGISASMFHAYRSGKYPISPKVWRKLEAAERSAGIEVKNPDADADQGTGFALNETHLEYKALPKPQQNDPFSSVPHGRLQKGSEPEEGNKELISVLHRIASALEVIAEELHDHHPKTSSKAHGDKAG